MKQMRKLFIFDLDNTLVNLLSYHDRAISKAFAEVFGVGARFSELDYAGKSIPQLIQELGKARKLDAKQVKKELRAIERIYELEFVNNLPRKINALSGAKRLLLKIKHKGHLSAIYTGGLHKAVASIIKKAKLSVDIVATTENAKRREDMIAAIMRKARKRLSDLRAKGVTVIGDSANDVIAGKRAGAKTIAVTTGPHSRQRLLKEKPDRIVSSLAQVMNYV